ncbi:MAG: thiosulfohydrolase SoxB [Hyphomicrobiales bacterium]|nr:MAG: thiosulfohydrolase SoxB [Hyphomicrobiales bacterium]
MITRRDFLTAATSAAAFAAGASLGGGRVFAQGVRQEDLLRFEATGNVTLLHITDLHGQLMPLYFREPSINIGVGEVKGKVPHLTGADVRQAFSLPARSPLAHALTYEDFAELARNYGRMGGLDRIATIVKSVRAERDGKVLLLDGGDTWTNSWTSLKTQGQDMVEVMNLLKPDAITGHWEFTLGEKRVKEIVDALPFAFLAQNILENEFEDRVFPAQKMFERGGVKIAVIGQAFPFTPIANPRWMIPKWTFGLREKEMQKEVDEARASGADLVVVLSHNGFDVDRKMVQQVSGIDVILTGHTHDAVPEIVKIGKTLMVASGCHGKFVSRLDLDVQGKEIKGFKYRLIPVFSDAIKPDADVAAAIARQREPYKADLARVLGKAEGLLYRRGNFNGTLDDMICDAIRSERDAEIALSPGIRWGTSLLPGQDITFEDITNATAMTYPNCYRMTMTGARLKEILEDVADNIFNPDPYYQQGGDMVRTGGLAYAIDVAQPIGKRISHMTLLKTGKEIEPAKEYVVAGWASINEGTEGPAIWDVVASYVTKKKSITVGAADNVKITGI